MRVVACLAVVAWSLAFVQDGYGARFATAGEQRALQSEAVYYLRILARSGTALFAPGLKVVVQPACISTADSAFALVTVFALNPSNPKQVLDPGQLWLGRLGSGPPRAIGALLLADAYGTRPRGVSAAAHRDTANALQCQPQVQKTQQRVRAGTIRIYTV